MEKMIFQEYSESQREQMLADNADRVEEVGYMKPFSTEELDTMKDDLSKVVININEVEEEKKAVNQDFKLRLKPLAEDKQKLLNNIKNKSEYVTEDCFKMIDHEEEMVGYYNSLGMLIEARPIRQEERQRTIFNILRTGTNE